MKGALSLLLLLPCLFLLNCSAAEGAILLFSVLAHEAGHVLCARACGGTLRSLSLSPAGLTLDLGCDALPYKKELLVHLAGPAANLLLLLPALFLIRNSLSALRLFFFFCNALLAFLNLLPVRGLDGGRALYCALCLHLSPDTASLIVGIAGGIALLFLCHGALHLLFFYHNPSLAVLCLALLLEEGGLLLRHKKRGTKYPRSS
ncbi:MAG: M50 family metallopeptidase [Clostridia bacterium]|nr:M50 family metallopeptidase [Clostridia bacterium]